MNYSTWEKKQWDGFCQPGRAQGPRRLRLIALRLLYAQELNDWDQEEHYFGLWLDYGGQLEVQEIEMGEARGLVSEVVRQTTILPGPPDPPSSDPVPMGAEL